jgi:hypothetical protein
MKIAFVFRSYLFWDSSLSRSTRFGQNSVTFPHGKALAAGAPRYDAHPHQDDQALTGFQTSPALIGLAPSLSIPCLQRCQIGGLLTPLLPDHRGVQFWTSEPP